MTTCLQAAGAGAINCELFAKGEGNVALLLGLLAQEDFYVRYYTLQLMTALAVGGSFRLQQVQLVLGSSCCVLQHGRKHFMQSIHAQRELYTGALRSHMHAAR